MAVPRKGRRSIQVAEDTFFWVARLQRRWYNGGGPYMVNLYVEHTEVPSAKIHVSFDPYAGPWGLEQNRDIAITPDIVRQVIERVMRTGWNPWSAKKIVEIENAEQFITVAEAETDGMGRFTTSAG